jgi:hypothetical protein
MEQIYTSKVDVWLIAVLIGVALLGFLVGLAALRASGVSGKRAPFLFTALLPLAIGLGLPIWMYTSTRYVLNDNTLLVKSGGFSWQIPVAEITAITPTRNARSSPALSLDRLRIDYSVDKSVMISPKLKQQFLQDLDARRAKPGI